MTRAPAASVTSQSSTPPRVVLAMPHGELLLEVAMNLMPLAEAGLITLVLEPGFEPRNGDEPGLVIQGAVDDAGAPRGKALRVTGPGGAAHLREVKLGGVRVLAPVKKGI